MQLVFFIPAAWAQPSQGNEGMWMPEQLDELYVDMRHEGLRLTQQAIYAPGQEGLYRTVLRLNGGECSASLVSSNGLVLTNHHCLIEVLEEAGMRDWPQGYWATSASEELPLYGLTATMLLRSEEVTSKVVGPGYEDRAGMESRKAQLIAEATEGTDYLAEIKSFYGGNEFRLFVYRVFRDIRLAGLPPLELARWQDGPGAPDWPRYQADFAFLRLYVGPDSSAAEFDETNIPLPAASFLPISTTPKQQGDFALVMGYPGKTFRYASTAALQHVGAEEIPLKAEILEQKAHWMEQFQGEQLKRDARLASQWMDLWRSARYYRNQLHLIRRFDIMGKKQEQELAFQQWVLQQPERKQLYGHVLPELQQLYADFKDEARYVNLLYRKLLAAEAASLSLPFLLRLKPVMHATVHERTIQMAAEELNTDLEAHFEQFHYEQDLEIFYRGLLAFYQEVSPPLRPPVFNDIMAHKSTRKGNTPEEKLRLWVEYAYSRSLLTHPEQAASFVKAPDLEQISQDPLFDFMDQLVGHYRSEIALEEARFSFRLEELDRLYQQGLMLMDGKNPYPDANSTLRIAYGKVAGYEPRDAVTYLAFSHLSGMIRSSHAPFSIPLPIQQAWENRLTARGEQHEELVVCFLTNHDISAGNSGSPVLNGRGELIGCVFDANAEAAAGDFAYVAAYQRALCVDIHFILWVTELYGGRRLLDEMLIRP